MIGLSYAPLMYNIIGWLIVLGYGVVALTITLDMQPKIKNLFSQNIINFLRNKFKVAWLPITVILFSAILTYFLYYEWVESKYVPIVILIFLSVVYSSLQHFREKQQTIRDIKQYFSLVKGREEELHISDFLQIIAYSDYKPRGKLKVSKVKFSSGEINGVKLKLHRGDIVNWDLSEFTSGTDLEETMAGAIISGGNFEMRFADQYIIRSIDFSFVTFNKVSFQNLKFENCNFSGVEMYDCQLRNVEIEGVHMNSFTINAAMRESGNMIHLGPELRSVYKYLRKLELE